ncbi:uncharacterized protein [Euphorbia lathyris]|uniref:uncharacterized protein n=1 Tax=Euphorbia lathyris TaxID=212925 RepID=UPI003313EF08
MPVADPTSGRIFIWLVACLLFTSVAVGGSFLILYVTLPDNVSQPWFPFAGVSLVCLPWLFWCFTCVYRIVSRTLGFRFVLGSDGPRGNNLPTTSSSDSHGSSNALEATLESARDGDGDGRQVQSAGSAVTGENDKGDENKENTRSLSNSISSNNLSFASHESEVPLTSSMSS